MNDGPMKPACHFHQLTLALFSCLVVSQCLLVVPDVLRVVWFAVVLSFPSHPSHPFKTFVMDASAGAPIPPAAPVMERAPGRNTDPRICFPAANPSHVHDSAPRAASSPLT